MLSIFIFYFFTIVKISSESMLPILAVSIQPLVLIDLFMLSSL